MYGIWTIIHTENTWNQFRHAFCFKILSFVLDLNYYSQREHLKPISSCFVSIEYSYLCWMWMPTNKENTWNQFRHDFCLKNIQVCTGSEQLFTKRTLIKSNFIMLSVFMNFQVCTGSEKLFTQRTLKNNFVMLSVFMNIQVCTGSEQLFTLRTLKNNFVMLFVSWIFRFVLDLNNYSHREHL